jgi:hypothetical protein
MQENELVNGGKPDEGEKQGKELVDDIEEDYEPGDEEEQSALKAEPLKKP